MGFTYDLNTNVGKVRLLIGDTDENDILLQDEEIGLFIKEYGNIRTAASRSAMAISAAFSRHADKQIGSLKISLSARADKYMELSKELKSNAASVLPPYVGGISVSDMEVNLANSDRVTQSFRRNSMNNTGG